MNFIVSDRIPYIIVNNVVQTLSIISHVYPCCFIKYVLAAKKNDPGPT